MRRIRRLAATLAVGATLVAGVPPALSSQPSPPPAPESAPGTQQPAPLDPAISAVLVALAAAMLRDAAASPDPMASLGQAFERTLSNAISSPETARLIESIVATAVKDAPPELREPLAQFALSMLRSARRDMGRDRGPRPGF